MWLPTAAPAHWSSAARSCAPTPPWTWRYGAAPRINVPRHRCDDGGCSIITLYVTQVGAVLKHADTSKPRGIDTDLSPKRTAARLGAAVDLAARRSAYVLSDEPRGSPPARLRSLAPEAGGCRRKSCQKLRALLREREDSSHDRAAAPSRRTTSQTHRDVFDVYTSMNEQLLAVARDACVELMRSGLRAQNLAPSLF